jgi:hypothetical protein
VVLRLARIGVDAGNFDATGGHVDEKEDKISRRIF